MGTTGGAKILVVEDEGLVALALERCLQRANYEVAALVPSGEEAIELAREIRPDLVLMDIRLKGKLDGIEAAAAIWQELEIPVVYLTAHGEGATLARARETAAFGYLPKPYQDCELQLTVETALGKHRLNCQMREKGECWGGQR